MSDFDDEDVEEIDYEAVEEFDVHESAEGYVTVIYTYKEEKFQVQCVEGDTSPWFDSLGEAESWILRQGVW